VDPLLVLVGALNLAAKVEDLPLSLLALLKEFEALRTEGAKGRNAARSATSPTAEPEWKEAITQVECEIVRLLQYDPSFELP